jgi:N-acetylglutamate synthase-like GNAT family acetyltransferase
LISLTFSIWSSKITILTSEKLSLHILQNANSNSNWRHGVLNKSHYILDKNNEIIGCLNLIHLMIYIDRDILYFDTLDIKVDYRGRGFGSQTVGFVIESEQQKYEKFNIFLLVAKCEQFKLKFFTNFGFIPIKLRRTKLGEHYIMSYPFNEYLKKLCQELFDFFNWIEEKKDLISSNCKFACHPNPTVLYWCAKKKIYVSGFKKKSCRYYQENKKQFHK